MYFIKKRKTFLSADKTRRCECCIYLPAGTEPPAGIVQIVGGMRGYSGSCEHFAGNLCRSGFIVCARDPQDADMHNWIYLVKDTVLLTRLIKREFPGLPLIIYGHGIGSLIVRAAMTKHGREYAGIVTEGTLSFLTDVRALSASDFRSLFMLIYYVSRAEWYFAAVRDVPVLILEGTDDPIGSFGRGGVGSYKRMRRAGFRSVKIMIYENARHGLPCGQAAEDIVIWIKRILNGDE